MAYIDTGVVGAMTPDRRGDKVETLSVKNWRASKKAITNAAWVSLSDGSPRSSIMMVSTSANPATIILGHSSSTSSNDLTNAACGIPLAPGSSVAFSFTENIPVYARVVSGGGACSLYVAEAL